jgi:hypothetical protein
VTDEQNKSAAKVSMTKPGAAAPDPQVPAPRHVKLAAGAMVLAAVANIGAAAALLGEKAWLTDQQRKADAKTVRDAVAKAKKDHVSDIESVRAKAQKALTPVGHAVSQAQTGALIQAAIVAVVLVFLAWGAYRGRHWTRWGVLGFWLLASLTGSVVGVSGVLQIGSSIPTTYKIAAALAGLLMIAAIVLVTLRPSLEYFAAHKPVQAPGAPARRGLFAPRTPPGGGRTAAGDTGSATAKAKSALTSSAASRGEAYVERQRAKKRATANAESIARGAELARSRAKASKSRRIETR